MNEKIIKYIILISIIFISLGIGIYLFNIKEGADYQNIDNVNQKVDEYLRDAIGNLEVDNTGNMITIKKLNSHGIVETVQPDIKLDIHGYAVKDADNKVIVNTPNSIFQTSNDKDPKTKYNSDNLDVTYHDSEKQVSSEAGNADLEDGTVYVKDKEGNTIALPKINVQGSVTYYQPDSYRFGASTYVPTYEDSVYLSRTTGLSTTGVVANPAYMLGGVCKYYNNQPDKLEEACQKMNKDTCASTSCCVLLGGSKCVSGNEQGPVVKSNFSDVYVRNRDFYYFQGKCYGNCQ